MPATVQEAIDGILLDTVRPRIAKRDEMKSVFSARLQRNTDGTQGDNIISKTEIMGEQGMGAAALYQAYPTAQSFKTLDAMISLKRNQGSLECWNDERILSTHKLPEAAANIILYKAKSFIENFAIDMGRQYWGDGSGKLGTVVGAHTTQTVINVNSVQYFKRNMLVDFHEGTVVEDKRIVSVSRKDTTITVDSEVTLTDGTVITRANAKDNEITGLVKMVDDGTTYAVYENISRVDFEEWASLILTGSGQAFDLTKVNELLVKGLYDYDADYTAIYCDSVTLESIIYLTQKKGYNLSSTKVQLGYEAPVLITPKGGIPIIVEKPCPALTFWALTEPVIELRRPQPPTFIPGVRGYWMPHPDYPKEYAHMEYLAEMFTVEPWKNSRYENYITAVGT